MNLDIFAVGGGAYQTYEECKDESLTVCGVRRLRATCRASAGDFVEVDYEGDVCVQTEVYNQHMQRLAPAFVQGKGFAVIPYCLTDKLYAQNIGLYSSNDNGTLTYGIKDGWRENVAAKVQKLKDEGIWDAVIGFDWDEPMLQSTNEIVEQVAEEYAKYGKRQRAIFSYYELIEGSHPRSNDPEFGKEGHLINPQSCRFFTDVGFDLYHPADYDKHLNVLNEMKRRVGREDVSIWLVPCTWSISNRFGQEHAVNHLNMCYKLLTEQEHPGGLTCYNWYSFGNKGESLDWLLDERNESRWTNLESRMLEIANEVINTPLK